MPTNVNNKQIAGPQLRSPVGSTGQPGFADIAMPSPPSYELYRQMRCDPTIALARMIVRAPVEGAKWSYAANDDVPDERTRFIQAAIEPHRAALVRGMLGALDFGWQGFEIVFKPQAGRVAIERIKPLLHDITAIRVSRRSGRFVAFDQRGVRIDADKAMLFTNDADGDDPYGRPRLENVRDTWLSWRRAEQAAAQYDRKIAGVFPIIHYPPGQGIAADGQADDNFKLAMSLARAMQAGKPVVVPNEFASWADDRQLGDAHHRRWLIELLEDRGGRQADFVERLRYLDALKFRGMLRPERAGLEAAHGTRADAAEHGDLALVDSAALLAGIASCINEQLVNRLLELNFGEAARNSIKLRPAPIRAGEQAALRDLILKLTQKDQGIASVLKWIDWDAAIDAAGLPKSREIV